MHMYPQLPAYPSTSDPNIAQKAVIDNRIADAIDIITHFLAPSPGGYDYLDAVFGAAQRGQVEKHYQVMQQVLASWRDNAGMVKVSGWTNRFGRSASTNGVTKVLTLPDFPAVEPPADLRRTLIHESAHGVQREIIDAAYSNAAVAFATIPGPDRPLNAPYYDYAIEAWRGGSLETTRQEAGNPNATTGPEVQLGSPQLPVLGTQFQRTQSIVTHARIHAENMLELLTEHCRNGIVDKAAMGIADGLPMPFLARYWKSWVNTDYLSEADIVAANDFVVALTAFHTSISATTYTITMTAALGAESCAVNPQTGVMDIRARMKAEMAPHLIKGDLTADPWVQLMTAGLLTAYPQLPASGLTAAAIGQVDQQYHVTRNQNGHP